MSPSKVGELEIAPDPSWEERVRTRSWDVADAYRTAILRETNKSARLRWEAGEYIVEWRS